MTAMKKNSNKRQVNGILLLDKPSGISSNHALQHVKRVYRASKAGHTGTLDPLASGLLPICLGEATKFSRYFLAEDKIYHVKAKLGIRTTTGDCEGEVSVEREVPSFTLSALDKNLENFRGDIIQIPPMFSAIKYHGQPLYKFARQGREIARPSRNITIFELKLISYQDEILEFQVHCSKGTYIRALVDDLGEQLGCGAYVIYLHRIGVGRFRHDSMHELQKIDHCENPDELLLPLSTAVADLPAITVTTSQAESLRLGQSVSYAAMSVPVVAIFADDALLGVGEITEEAKLYPRRLVSCHDNDSDL